GLLPRPRRVAARVHRLRAGPRPALVIAGPGGRSAAAALHLSQDGAAAVLVAGGDRLVLAAPQLGPPHRAQRAGGDGDEAGAGLGVCGHRAHLVRASTETTAVMPASHASTRWAWSGGGSTPTTRFAGSPGANGAA